MRQSSRIAVIIPALNEAPAIGAVIKAVPDWVDQIVVADNGSTDATAQIARDAGARVVFEPQRGYGAACLAAIEAMAPADVVVFVDGDYSDRPGEMDRLVDPILDGRADLVIGSRVLGRRQRGALTIPQLAGNWLACRLIGWIWGVATTDLGPFRAIGYASLMRLGMADRD